MFLWFMNRRSRFWLFASSHPRTALRDARRSNTERMSLRAFINSPTGPKTTHFWGPVANWGFVVAVRPSFNARVGFD